MAASVAVAGNEPGDNDPCAEQEQALERAFAARNVAKQELRDVVAAPQFRAYVSPSVAILIRKGTLRLETARRTLNQLLQDISAIENPHERGTPAGSRDYLSSAGRAGPRLHAPTTPPDPNNLPGLRARAQAYGAFIASGEAEGFYEEARNRLDRCRDNNPPPPDSGASALEVRLAERGHALTPAEIGSTDGGPEGWIDFRSRTERVVNHDMGFPEVDGHVMRPFGLDVMDGTEARGGALGAALGFAVAGGVAIELGGSIGAGIRAVGGRVMEGLSGVPIPVP